MPEEFVGFSSRYGLVEGLDLWGQEHWRGRHADHSPCSIACCPSRPQSQCACPGNAGKRQCCAELTAEDLLCDECREYCWAITSHGERVRLIDVYLAVDKAAPAGEQRG